MSDSWEKHQEHVLSELNRISDKVDSLDRQMVEFHTNHLTEVKTKLTRIETTLSNAKYIIPLVGGALVVVLEMLIEIVGKAIG